MTCLQQAGKRKPGQGNLSASQKKRNRRNSRVRARVEHVFRIIKCQFGYRKVRYKGLAKNKAQVTCLQQAGELDGAGQCVSAAPVVDGVMSASLRLKDTKVVKKYQKRGHYLAKAGQSVSKTMNLSIKRQIH